MTCELSMTLKEAVWISINVFFLAEPTSEVKLCIFLLSAVFSLCALTSLLEEHHSQVKVRNEFGLLVSAPRVCWQARSDRAGN